MFVYEVLRKLKLGVSKPIALLGFEHFELAEAIGISVVQGEIAAENCSCISTERVRVKTGKRNTTKLMPSLIVRSSRGCSNVSLSFADRRDNRSRTAESERLSNQDKQFAHKLFGHSIPDNLSEEGWSPRRIASINSGDRAASRKIRVAYCRLRPAFRAKFPKVTTLPLTSQSLHVRAWTIAPIKDGIGSPLEPSPLDKISLASLPLRAM